MLYTEYLRESLIKGFSDPIEDAVLLFYLYSHSRLDWLFQG